MSKLDKLDQNQKMEKDDYKSILSENQLALLEIQQLLLKSKRTLILAFEGPDAGGKGGAIKRVVEMLDQRSIDIHSIQKPTPEEYRHHYMWRFWTKLPGEGEIAIFDRTWYGRVLVERVEGFATVAEWRRAYNEINEFERTLIDGGAILMKFWVHIDKDEQHKRFERRQKDPFKRWKISKEDWRNRDKWDQHIEAAEDMFKLTSTEIAPWNIIAGNYKWFSRTAVIKLIVEKLALEFKVKPEELIKAAKNG